MAVDLICAGEAFEDLIFADLPAMPEPGHEVRTTTFIQTVGGGAVITAIAARRLGVTTQIVSGLGPAAVRLLRTEGVRVTNLRRSQEPAAVSVSMSTRTDRSFATYTGMNDRLPTRLARRLASVSARHVHLAFFPPSCRAWVRIVNGLRRRGISTSWDFGWNLDLLKDRHFQTLTAALDCLFLNEAEAVKYSRCRTLERAAQFWRRHSWLTVIKLGARGARLIAGDLDVTIRASKVRTVDTTGAGDAFNGGFLCARLEGLSLRDSLRLGNIVGALSTRAPGGIRSLPRRPEIS